ncbi:hypothetical protein MASR1M32_39150 [Rhodobacter sp.]
MPRFATLALICLLGGPAAAQDKMISVPSKSLGKALIAARQSCMRTLEAQVLAGMLRERGDTLALQTATGVIYSAFLPDSADSDLATTAFNSLAQDLLRVMAPVRLPEAVSEYWKCVETVDDLQQAVLNPD